MNKYEKINICRKTILEMLNDRGYNITEYLNNDKIDILSLNQIKEEYIKNNCKIIVNKNKDDKICVLFYDEKIGIEMMKEIINNIIYKDKIYHLILVIREKLTSFAKKQLNYIPSNSEIEVFLQHNTLFNVTHHVKVPKHELISEPEKIKEIIDIYGKNLPKISKSDKVCQYYNGKIGEIFKIYRQNTIYYRQVINDIDK